MIFQRGKGDTNAMFFVWFASLFKTSKNFIKETQEQITRLIEIATFNAFQILNQRRFKCHLCRLANNDQRLSTYIQIFKRRRFRFSSLVHLTLKSKLSTHSWLLSS